MNFAAPPANSGRRSILLIGLAPAAVDFSAVPGLDESTLSAALQAALDDVVAAGFDASWCLTSDNWESAEAAISASIAARRPDVVMIGAGLRTLPANFLLFEKIVNLVHAAAPGAKLCFNTSPDSTLAAIRRWCEP
jgi:hypothetical protein